MEQSILLSSWTVSPRNCVIEQKSEWKPVITPVISYTLDSRPMEGITYLERPAPGVSLDSWPIEGASCLRPLEQSVLNSSIAARSVEDVVREVSDRKSVINPVTDVNSENLHMRISPDPVPLEQSVPRASSECYEQSYTDASDDMNTDLPESLTPMLKPLTAFEWPCVNSPLLPTAKPEVVNQRKDSFDMNTNLPESSTPMIDSDLSIENLGGRILPPLRIRWRSFT